MPKKTLRKGNENRNGNGSATDQVKPPHTHRSGMVIRSSAMYLSPCSELFCRKYLMLFLAASRLQSDTSSSLECSSLPCRCLPCIVPCCCCFLFVAGLRALRAPSPCDFMLQLAELPRHAGAIYIQRCQLQLIRITSSGESEIILTRGKHDDDCDKFQIELAAQQVPLNGRLCPPKRGVSRPVASAMFADPKEFQIMQMHRHFARASPFNGDEEHSKKQLTANKTINLCKLWRASDYAGNKECS